MQHVHLGSQFSILDLYHPSQIQFLQAFYLPPIRQISLGIVIHTST
jgi:hypothetical protein